MAEVLAFLDFCEASDPALHRAITTSLALITGALHLFSQPRELCLSFNGGKDCTVVLHLLRAALLRASAPALGSPGGPGVVYFRGAEPEFPEVASFISATEAAFGFACEAFSGFKSGLSELVARPEGGGRLRGVLMGTRASDPAGAFLCGPFSPTSPGWPPVMRVNPILGWSYGQVWAFLRGVPLPFCELYARGFTSLGAPSDSSRNPSLAVPGGGGRWRPAWELEDGALEREGRGGSEGGNGHPA
jgi:FAD synthetase